MIPKTSCSQRSLVVAYALVAALVLVCSLADANQTANADHKSGPSALIIELPISDSLSKLLLGQAILEANQQRLPEMAKRSWSGSTRRNKLPAEAQSDSAGAEADKLPAVPQMTENLMAMLQRAAAEKHEDEDDQDQQPIIKKMPVGGPDSERPASAADAGAHSRRILNDGFGILREASRSNTNNHLGMGKPPQLGSEEEY